MRNSIRTRMTITFSALVAGLLLLVGIVLALQSYVSEQRQALAFQNERAQRISIEVLSYMQIQEHSLTELIDVHGLDKLSRSEQTQLLSSLVSLYDTYNKLSLINANGQERIVISSTEITPQLRNVSQADEFFIPATTQQIYYGPVQFSEKTGEPYLIMALPMVDVRSGTLAGVLSAEVRLKPVWDLLANLSLGKGSNAYIVDSENRVVAHNNPSIVLKNTLFSVPNDDGIHPGIDGSNMVITIDPIRLGEQKFIVVTETPISDALAALINTEVTILVLLLVATAVAAPLGWLAARQIVHPIEELVKTAQAVSSGDLSKQAAVTQRDEIGNLAIAFNQMTSQLQDLIGSLEQRVADRTRALSTVAEVGAAASTILETNQLLQQVVDLAKERFNFYHAHIYLLNDAGDTLVLSSGAGAVGRQMVSEGRTILMAREQSLVARAARDRKGVTVNDVTQEPDFLPNPLLPDTRAEMAIPMMVGEQVIGVFDVQSEVAGRFTDADIAVQTTLASQVASAAQNTRLYSETLEAQKLTRNVIDSTDDWIFIKDQNHRYRLVNQGYANSLHIPIADFIGKNDLELGFPEELVKGNPEKGIRGFWADDRSVMDDGVTKQIPDDLVTIDGNVHVFDTVKVPLRDADNKVWGVLAFARDMTERRQLEELNRKRASQQEAINKITQRIQSATTIEEAMQVAARELGHALGMKPTLVSLAPGALTSNQLGVPSLANTESMDQ